MEDCISAIANVIPSVARGDGIIFNAKHDRCFIASFDRDVGWDCNCGYENTISGTCVFAPVTRSSYNYITERPDCYETIPDGIVKLPFSPTTNLKQYLVEAPFNAFEVLTSGVSVDKDIKMPRTFYKYDAARNIGGTIDTVCLVTSTETCLDLDVTTLETCIDRYIALYESGNWGGPSPMDGVVVEFDATTGCIVGSVQFTETTDSCGPPSGTSFAVLGFELPTELAVDCPVPEIVLRDIVDFDTATENASALNKLMSPPVGSSFGGKPILKGLFDFASFARPSAMSN